VFDSLSKKPDDPILALLVEARNDPSPNVVDLSAGVYKSEDGHTPIFSAIKNAEARRQTTEATKSYLGIRGDERFNQVTTELILGKDHPALAAGRVSSIQTIGGSGALFVGGRLLAEANPNVTIWAGDPTWGNHIPLLTSAGAAMRALPYYDRANHRVDFDAFSESLRGLSDGAVALLHGCCHNPTGADFSNDQWDQVANIILEKNLIPFVDVAYHGLAKSLDQDAYGWRMLAERVPEMLIAYSCSKNFGVYRDRAGLLAVISKNAETADKTLSNMMSICRSIYSMPAAHGAFSVAEVLDDAALRASWLDDLNNMRDRIDGARSAFVAAINRVSPSLNFNFVTDQFGMFSFLGITPDHVNRLKTEHSVYMLESSRINVAGLTDKNIDYVAAALADVLS